MTQSVPLCLADGHHIRIALQQRISGISIYLYLHNIVNAAYAFKDLAIIQYGAYTETGCRIGAAL